MNTVLARLLTEISWYGASVRKLRNGGRGLELALTAETLQALDFLPRKAFFGAVLAAAHGAERARSRLVEEIEEARFTLLPGDHFLGARGADRPGALLVQPDGIIETPSTYTVVEVKRIRPSPFRPEQLAREFVLSLEQAGGRTPLLLLILGAPPPVTVAKHGKLTIPDGIALHLQSVLERSGTVSPTVEEALSRIPEIVCWVTWHEVAAVVEAVRQAIRPADESVRGCIDRLATVVTRSIERHGG